ncbi:MAG: hypothetical protein AAF298_00395 [Cyanobacteria bacterium P01_A01_bin.40]
MNFNIPSQITQGDSIKWVENFSGHDSLVDVMKCFIVGQSNSLTVSGNAIASGFEFEISGSMSQILQPGKYKAQFAFFLDYVNVGSDRKNTLGTTNLLVCPSFESLTELETRSADEIELEAITKAINKLASGAVAEYYIGDRRMRYQDLGELTKRQQYLRTRIAIASGRIKAGGRNVGVRFND